MELLAILAFYFFIFKSLFWCEDTCLDIFADRDAAAARMTQALGLGRKVLLRTRKGSQDNGNDIRADRQTTQQFSLISLSVCLSVSKIGFYDYLAKQFPSVPLTIIICRISIVSI